MCKRLASRFPADELRLPYDAMVRIAENQYPPNADWPWTMTTLGQLLHSTASPDMVSRLVCRDEFWEDVQHLQFFDHGACGHHCARCPCCTTRPTLTHVLLAHAFFRMQWSSRF